MTTKKLVITLGYIAFTWISCLFVTNPVAAEESPYLIQFPILEIAMERLFYELETLEKIDTIDIREKQQMAINHIKKIRFGYQKKDSFFIIDTMANMIVDPYHPEYVGRNMMDYKDPNGIEVFKEFVMMCRKDKGGYLEYLWPKYEGIIPVKRISLVRLFEEWDWIIGTGIYPQGYYHEMLFWPPPNWMEEEAAIEDVTQQDWGVMKTLWRPAEIEPTPTPTPTPKPRKKVPPASTG